MQFWTPTVCYELSMRKEWNQSSSICTKKKWLIGGLLPALQQNTGPAFCNFSIEFDALQLSPIITDLESKWIDYDNHTFLRNQWVRHGTCGAKIDGINNQFDYFNKSLELFDKFNMYNLFSNWTIVPGEKYLTFSIEEISKMILRKKIQLICLINRVSKTIY